jgi:DNA-binding response OmpR family regulator
LAIALGQSRGKAPSPSKIMDHAVGKSSTEKVHDITAESIAPGIRSVLMLEDDVTFSELLRDYLEENAFRVTRVTNGVEGLREILATDFDIILCDLVMPNLPGDKFYLAVERSRKHLCKRFVFITGYKTDPDWSGFLSKVQGPVLGKPFALVDLLSAIQTVLTENALNEPNAAE